MQNEHINQEELSRILEKENVKHQEKLDHIERSFDYKFNEQNKQIEKLEKLVSDFQKERDQWLKTGVMVLGGTVLSLLIYIWHLAVGGASIR